MSVMGCIVFPSNSNVETLTSVLIMRQYLEIVSLKK